MNVYEDLKTELLTINRDVAGLLDRIKAMPKHPSIHSRTGKIYAAPLKTSWPANCCGWR